jgi:hypothetical protein
MRTTQIQSQCTTVTLWICMQEVLGAAHCAGCWHIGVCWWWGASNTPLWVQAHLKGVVGERAVVPSSTAPILHGQKQQAQWYSQW